MLPALTAILGFLVSGLLEWWRDGRAKEREERARLALKESQIEERRAKFQRDTLLELQIALSELVRASAKAHLHEMAAFKETGEWHKNLLPATLDEEFLEAMGRTAVLGERVNDDATRAAVEDIRKRTAELSLNANKSSAEQEFRWIVIKTDEAHKKIGETLRALDQRGA